MGFIDTATILVIAGNGGSTIVSYDWNWRRKSNRRFCVSYGGNGGDVWLIANKGINTLNYFFFNKKFFAENGQNGGKNSCRGKSGASVFIQVPLGTCIYDQNGSVVGDLLYDHQKLMLAKGGRHGALSGRVYRNKIRSNVSKISRYLKQVISGNFGEKRNIRLELSLLADVGILGMPNTGKSTFVRCVSSAKPKIGDYPFTTLVPSLGVVYVDNDNFIVADIPGIIKGASVGLGLGFSFLKHLQRCRMLLHFVDLVPALKNSEILENIRVIINELKSYSKELAIKPIWLIFNKVDLLDPGEAKKRVNNILFSLKWKDRYYLISSRYNQGVSELCYDLMKFIRCSS